MPEDTALDRPRKRTENKAPGKGAGFQMNSIDLHFPVLGQNLPTDHGYALFGALARTVPWLHEPSCPALVGPVGGAYLGNGKLQLDSQRSRLRLRLPSDAIPHVLPLAGKSLETAGHKIRLGVPQVRAVIPAPNLVARMVTMKRSDRQDSSGTKGYMEPVAFLEAVCREFQKLDIQGQPDIPLIRQGPRAG